MALWNYIQTATPTTTQPPQTSAPSSTTSADADPQAVDASDFATTTKLPEWATSFIEEQTSKYSMPAWDAYQKSLSSLAKTPKYTEEARKASQGQFYTGIGGDVREESRDLAATQAAAGTMNSSIGTDQIAEFAKQVVASVATQHEQNIGAAESDYQNTVDQAAAAQAMSGMIGDYLSKTEESYSAKFAGMTFEPGTAVAEFQSSNPDGSGTWEPQNGLQEGETYGTIYTHPTLGTKSWTPPNGWEKISSSGVSPNQDTYTFEGQTFFYNERDGTIEGITGETAGQSIAGEDLAGTSELEDFAKKQIEDIVNKYGSSSMKQSSDKTTALAGYDVEGAGSKLNEQYAGLSADTMAILQSALGGAGGTGALAADFAADRSSALSSASLLGTSANEAMTKEWQAALQTKKGVDATNATGALAAQQGALLGLTRSTYKPDVESYLSYYSGQPPTAAENVSDVDGNAGTSAGLENSNGEVIDNYGHPPTKVRDGYVWTWNNETNRYEELKL